jgi:phosphoglucomutase
LGGIEVKKVRDIKNGADGLAPSDVLQFFLADGTIVSARPSGTEPKIKFYATCCAEAGSGGLSAAKTEAARKLDAIKKDIRAVIGD